ncbi:sensor histidine kinase [Embleya sp. NBC_00896]|uniref:sensor histidine kinase n=1 Tax=Embleya sp. NBC_00896 TaxID=2975961 RepID=UPI003865E342|nr:sensor histidine kinase [Embleya sp. NBC_00896]
MTTSSPSDSAVGLSRPMPWVPPMVYVAVLVGGLYGGVVADGPVGLPRLGGFATCLLLLLVLDHLERRRHPVRTPSRAAVVLLVARLALFAAAAGSDRSGVSRVLFVLVPFTAFFAFGRRVSVALSIACVGLMLVGNVLTVPEWYLRTDIVTDLLMSGLGLVLAVAMAAIAVGEQAGRVRLEHTLDELRCSHDQLADYAARVERLSAAQERNRLAREFHDGLGHHLTAIAIQLEKASAFQDLDAGVAQRAIADARWSAGRALDEVRVAVRALRDEAEPFSLSAALADLVRHIDGGPSRVTLEVSGEELGYHVESLTALYRAAQEGLTNAHRHAGATHVAVSARYGDREARLVVADDGRGFQAGAGIEEGGGGRAEATADDAGGRGGFGLRAMRERLDLLGGRVDVAAAPGRGTVVTVTVPRVPVRTAAVAR